MSFLSKDHSCFESLFHLGFPDADIVYLVLGVDTEEFANGPLPAHMVPLRELEEVTHSYRPVVIN